MFLAPKEKGQGLAEYALIIAFVAIVVIAILTILGPAVSSWYQAIIVGL